MKRMESSIFETLATIQDIKESKTKGVKEKDLIAEANTVVMDLTKRMKDAGMTPIQSETAPESETKLTLIQGGSKQAMVDEILAQQRETLQIREAEAKDLKEIYKQIISEEIGKINNIASGVTSPEEVSIRKAVIEALGAMDAAKKAGVDISGIEEKIRKAEKEAYFEDFSRRLRMLDKLANKENIIYSPEYLLASIKEAIMSAERSGIDVQEWKAMFKLAFDTVDKNVFFKL